jgi:hypothetical protein
MKTPSKAQPYEQDGEWLEPITSKEVLAGIVETAFRGVSIALSLIWAKLR